MFELLIIIPKMVRVSTLIHIWKVSIRKLASFCPVAPVSYLEMAFRAKQDTITKKVRAVIFSWLSMVWLPTPVCVLGTVVPTEPFATGSALPPLSPPSLFFSISGKPHQSTSRDKIKWVKNEDMWVLLHNGKSYNIAIMYFPPSSFSERTKGEYRIFKGSKIIGFSRTLEAAKRRAEKIKITGRVFK